MEANEPQGHARRNSGGPSREAARAERRLESRRVRDGLGPSPSRIEALLEAAAIRRMGWHVTRFRGQRADGTRSEPMRIAAPARTLVRPRRRAFDAIVLTRWSRFGNAVAQLVNAAFYATRFGASRVLMPPGDTLFLPSRRIGDIAFETAAFEALRPGETALVGRFYACPAIDEQPSPERRYAAAGGLVRPLLRPELLEPDPRLGADDVVAHLRSGDIFERADPNRHYGQPPLGFYLRAILSNAPRRVWLVYENHANPVIAALAGRLRAHGVDVVEQSASLAEDLRVMLTARRLVMGCGTLTEAVVALSGSLAEAHIFGHQRDIRPPGRAVTLSRWLDREGRFVDAVQSANWQNTPAQRQLLLDYPAEALDRVVEGPRPL